MSVRGHKRELLSAPSVSRREPMLDYMLTEHGESPGFNEAAFELRAMSDGGVKLTREIVDYVVAKCANGHDLLLRREKGEQDVEQFVYFLRNEARVKIGISVNPASRASALSFRPTDIIGVISGTAQLERTLHERFAEHRVGNTEWFQWCDEIAKFVDTFAEPLTKRHRSRTAPREKVPVPRVVAYKRLAEAILGARRT